MLSWLFHSLVLSLEWASEPQSSEEWFLHVVLSSAQWLCNDVWEKCPRKCIESLRITRMLSAFLEHITSLSCLCSAESSEAKHRTPVFKEKEDFEKVLKSPEWTGTHRTAGERPSPSICYDIAISIWEVEAQGSGVQGHPQLHTVWG